jgi:hypothetical protein
MPTDPQVQAATIQTVGGALFGGFGTGLWVWLRGRGRSSQDARCERICANMVAAMEAMLAAMEAIGAEHPGLNSAIVKVRVQIEHARNFLDAEDT